ncbi:GNAT family N-acetyltransferase [Solibacillus sp. MA9]|uniref:GNAT family N-acetyltransferase n=1 Tax=Solibacillus palustris TaxID=2908203 RepID=A0ABS9UG94_9BACL|nr:GNAT family N-acetyltransferase [Solibacillus sp. MA9]MCH7323357.1 GNAT family N-acetyltransferase [Solibacillus sp. MA9]
MIIRIAKLEDAANIAKVHVDSWRTTYKNIIPQSFLDKLSYEQRTTLWQNNMANPARNIFVAETNDEIIGFVVGEKRDTNTEPGATDLSAIYLFEHCQGKGVGKLLLKQIMHSFKEQGFHKVYVEVLADNKSREFYKYYGAEFVKTIPITIGGVTIDEEVYVWNSVDTVLEKF